MRPLPQPNPPGPRPARGGRNLPLATACREVIVARSAVGEPRHTAGLGRVDHDNLRRGVHYRVLVPDQARSAHWISARLRELARAGADVRTAAKVPMDALVVDRSVTLLPSASGVAAFDLASITTTTIELFERVWSSAVPFAAVPGQDVTARERELLTLLFAGCTDEAAAARLKVSVRTVRRTVSQLMDRLGARSRFQAGAKAADRGWLCEQAS